MSPSDAGFLLDLDRCTGCHACSLACSTENELGWGRSWRHLVHFNPAHLPQLPSFHLSLACNHCDEAPCAAACPALAITRDTDTGAMIIDPDHCMGCRYCSWVCPYDAPRFDDRAGVMGKCTLCGHRDTATPQPACVEACPTAALRFGPLEGRELVPGFPRSNAAPRIRFDATQRSDQSVESTWRLPDDVLEAFGAAVEDPAPRITLLGEWPLLAFSLIAVGLVSWVWADVLGVARVHPAGFGALALLAMASSTRHLGRRSRAWRAILNLRRSWLSREIFCFSGFVAWTMAALVGGFVLWPAALLGVVSLFCIDRVYDPVRAWGAKPLHSADTLPTALTLVAAVAGAPELLALRVGLYGWRRWRERTVASRADVLVAGLRLGVGFLAPLALWWLRPDSWAALALVSLGAGEILDRAEFYAKLRVITPRRQACQDTTDWLANGAPASGGGFPS